eukprot:2963784-Pyramimonas_sp.AAC.1
MECHPAQERCFQSRRSPSERAASRPAGCAAHRTKARLVRAQGRASPDRPGPPPTTSEDLL